MLISDNQHQANLRNAQHSPGPRTSAGKAAASLNTVTYVLRARSLLLASENHEDYHQLCAALEAEWQPQTPTERFYLEPCPPPTGCSPARTRARSGTARACH